MLRSGADRELTGPSAESDAAATLQIGRHGPDGGTRTKWFPDGRPRPFPGNTFLATDPDTRFTEALHSISSVLDRSAAAGVFARLPDDTMHATVLNGTVGAPGYVSRWPAHIPPSEPIELVTEDFVTRLRAARLDVPSTLRFEVRGVSDISDPDTQLEVLLTPDPIAAQAMSTLRDQLTSLLHLPAQEDQRFHVTVAYRLHPWPDAASLVKLQQDLASLLPDEVTFHAVRFARFDDMTRYVHLVRL